MRILVVSHPPLSAQFGAAQIALSLTASLRERGHDALAWSPAPLPAGAGWWNVWRRQAQSVERFAAAHGPFDVIDTPAITASRELAHHGRLVARSVQPELLYMRVDLRSSWLRRPSPTALASTIFSLPRRAALLAGWRRASAILCLGNSELQWMKHRFPDWERKLRSYVSAPSPSERSALLAVRSGRRLEPRSQGTRFVWMGRWAAHKGTRRLLRWFTERASDTQDTLTLAGCGSAAEHDLPRAWLRSGRVRTVPSFSRADLPELLAGHDAGLFTSTVEGWGLTLNEMLESGMPVFATEAGGVTDLRDFFPQSLRAFPPPVQIGPRPQLEDLENNGYLARFDWADIARRYEEEVLGPILDADRV